MLLRDGCVCLELRLGGCGRQSSKKRRAVFTAPVQNRCAAKHDGGPFRARSEQHRQDAENHVVADDHVGREVPQNLLQALVLSGDGVDEQALYRDAQPLRPRRYVFQFGNHRDDVSQIEIRARGKRVESRPDAYDALAQRVAR
jgi:hypothetical protein